MNHIHFIISYQSVTAIWKYIRLYRNTQRYEKTRVWAALYTKYENKATYLSDFSDILKYEFDIIAISILSRTITLQKE